MYIWLGKRTRWPVAVVRELSSWTAPNPRQDALMYLYLTTRGSQRGPKALSDKATKIHKHVSLFPQSKGNLVLPEAAKGRRNEKKWKRMAETLSLLFFLASIVLIHIFAICDVPPNIKENMSIWQYSYIQDNCYWSKNNFLWPPTDSCSVSHMWEWWRVVIIIISDTYDPAQCIIKIAGT